MPSSPRLGPCPACHGRGYRLVEIRSLRLTTGVPCRVCDRKRNIAITFHADNQATGGGPLGPTRPRAAAEEPKEISQ